ncbi:MAG: MFS transporter [Dehalococcoidia bacterium]|nr:MFS transporter [Dehalococcoidia bacterium]
MADQPQDRPVGADAGPLAGTPRPDAEAFTGGAARPRGRTGRLGRQGLTPHPTPAKIERTGPAAPPRSLATPPSTVTPPPTQATGVAGASAAQAPPKRGWRLEVFSSLRHRDYRYLWIGTVCSSAGMWIQQVTLGWLVYDMTGSSVLLGAVNGIRALPFLFTGPFAGVTADRVDRKKLMLYTQLVLTVTPFIMGVLVLSGQAEVWHVFVFTILTGIGWSFNQPVRQALVGSVVPRQDLPNAIALNSAAFNLTRIVGPAVGGLLILVFTAGGNFIVQGLAYMGVAFMIWRMHVPPNPPVPQGVSVLQSLREGARWVIQEPTVRVLMALAWVPAVFGMPYHSLMPIFAEDVLHVGPVGLGLLLAATGVGAFAGAMGVASANRAENRGRVLLISLACWGATLVGFSQISKTGSMPLSMLSLVITGLVQQTYMATNQTLLQIRIPNELRGRVMSLYMLNMGLQPLGAFFGGVLAHWIGAPDTVTVMGAMCVVLAGIVARLLPSLRRVE